MKSYRLLCCLYVILFAGCEGGVRVERQSNQGDIRAREQELYQREKRSRQWEFSVGDIVKCKMSGRRGVVRRCMLKDNYLKTRDEDPRVEVYNVKFYCTEGPSYYENLESNELVQDIEEPC